MADIKIQLDLAGLLNATSEISAKIFPLISQAVGAVAQQAQYQWKDGVKQARLWSGEKTPYMNSIIWKMTGDFSAEVSSDYSLAAEIEDGRPAKDLKKMLNTSQKVRRTKDGRRFLVIPFRHNTPGNDAHAPAMPDAVYAMAEQMTKSSVMSSNQQRPSGEITNLSPGSGMRPASTQTPFASNPATKQAYMVPRHQYQWGGRLNTTSIEGLTAQQHKNMQGMVRMDTSSGGQNSSAFMTFRVMIEDSTGWIVAPRPGLHLVDKTAAALQPLAEASLAEAVKRTFAT